MKFVVNKDGTEDKYRFQLVNEVTGEIVMLSVQAMSKFDVLQRIKLIQAAAQAASIEGLRTQ